MSQSQIARNITSQACLYLETKLIECLLNVGQVRQVLDRILVDLEQQMDSATQSTNKPLEFVEGL